MEQLQKKLREEHLRDKIRIMGSMTYSVAEIEKSIKPFTKSIESIEKSLNKVSEFYSEERFNEIEKSIGHKYFKREGTPGNYRYFYTEADYKAGKSNGEESKSEKKEDKPVYVTNGRHGVGTIESTEGVMATVKFKDGTHKVLVKDLFIVDKPEEEKVDKKKKALNALSDLFDQLKNHYDGNANEEGIITKENEGYEDDLQNKIKGVIELHSITEKEFESILKPYKGLELFYNDFK